MTVLVQAGDPCAASTSKQKVDPFATKVFLDPSGKEYFPKGLDKWFTKHLKVMGEPSIHSLRSNKEIEQFRFLHVPTFSKPIVFRGVQKGGRYFIQVTRLTGKGGYDPGEIEFTAQVEITSEEWKSIHNVIVDHFKNSNITKEVENMLSGLDGSHWVLESLIDGEYKIQDIWGADYWVTKDGLELLEGAIGDEVPNLTFFVHACRKFLVLTDFKLSERMVPQLIK